MVTVNTDQLEVSVEVVTSASLDEVETVFNAIATALADGVNNFCRSNVAECCDLDSFTGGYDKTTILALSSPVNSVCVAYFCHSVMTMTWKDLIPTSIAPSQ